MRMLLVREALVGERVRDDMQAELMRLNQVHMMRVNMKAAVEALAHIHQIQVGIDNQKEAAEVHSRSQASNRRVALLEMIVEFQLAVDVEFPLNITKHGIRRLSTVDLW